jgi:hypothetical protein
MKGLPAGRYSLQIDAEAVRSRLNSKERRRVLVAISNAVFVPPGYFLFLRGSTLMAQPFDAGKLESAGDPVPVAERVDQFAGNMWGQFSAS